LEIGFGNGEYTVKWAAANPDTLLMGVEVSFASLTRCARRIAEMGLSNLKVICVDARFMMKELFADEAFDQVMMNFPCPWPKTRHAKRRVTARVFTDGLAAVLKTGGLFELVTDEGWYAEEAFETLSRHEAFASAAVEVGVSRSVTTKYERKWLAMGKDITRLTAVKAKKFTVDRETWGFDWSEGDMPLHMKTGKPAPDGFAFLRGESGARGEARWVFKECYAASENGKKFLVETVSTDDGFEQRYYLQVSERGGDSLVKPDSATRIFLTPSVRFAVEDLARRLADAASRS
jgi:tRNA (guanine-N7-)-methyltransferase